MSRSGEYIYYLIEKNNFEDNDDIFYYLCNKNKEQDVCNYLKKKLTKEEDGNGNK